MRFDMGWCECDLLAIPSVETKSPNKSDRMTEKEKNLHLFQMGTERAAVVQMSTAVASIAENQGGKNYAYRSRLCNCAQCTWLWNQNLLELEVSSCKCSCQIEGPGLLRLVIKLSAVDICCAKWNKLIGSSNWFYNFELESWILNVESQTAGLWQTVLHAYHYRLAIARQVLQDRPEHGHEEPLHRPGQVRHPRDGHAPRLGPDGHGRTQRPGKDNPVALYQSSALSVFFNFFNNKMTF